MVGTPAPGWSPMILGSLSLRTVAGSAVPRDSDGGYSCSWMVTNDPGVTLPPHRGRVSGTQGQWWGVLLLLGTVGPPILVPPVSGSFRMFKMMMIMTHKYDKIIGKMIRD